VLWIGNWAYFVGGGATVGTRELMGPPHIAWEIARGFRFPLPWDYPPAVAWFFVPFTHVPLSVGFWINATVMLAACVASGVVAARIYGIPVWFSVLAVLAWEPGVVSISEGQNASLALLLSMFCILGLTQKRPLLAGGAVGLLLFKPTDALAFLLLLLIRRQWRSLAIVAAAAIAWYLAGVPAAARDWMWPYHYAMSMLAYYPHQDFSFWFIGVSTLASRMGAPTLIASGLTAALLLVWCTIAARVSMLEAASSAGLIAVATSPHANPYEAALLAPALFYVMTRLAEPWRTRIIATVYIAGGASVVRWFVPFDPMAIVVALGTLGYLAFRIAPATRARAKRPTSA
jgi:Glycosyltransferase family 87